MYVQLIEIDEEIIYCYEMMLSYHILGVQIVIIKKGNEIEICRELKVKGKARNFQ